MTVIEQFYGKLTNTKSDEQVNIFVTGNFRTLIRAPSLPHCCLPLACDTTYKRDIKSNFCAKLKLIFVAERWSAKRYDIYWAVKNLQRRIGALIENEKRNIAAAEIKFLLKLWQKIKNLCE